MIFNIDSWIGVIDKIKESVTKNTSNIALNSQTLGYTKKNFWSLGDVDGTTSVARGFNLEAGKYTISVLATSSDTETTQCLLQITREDGVKNTLYFNRNSRDSRNIILPCKAVTFNFYASSDYSKSVGDTFTFKDIQIEKGTTVATEYEPYVDNVDTRLNKCLQKTGDTMNSDAFLEFPYPSTDRRVKVGRGAIRYISPSSDLYWAEGLTYKDNKDTTQLGGIGAYGHGNTLDYYYVGAFDKPALKVMPDGRVIGKCVNDVNGNSIVDTYATKTQLGGCYLKYENGKYYIGYDDGTDETEV